MPMLTTIAIIRIFLIRRRGGVGRRRAIRRRRRGCRAAVGSSEFQPLGILVGRQDVLHLGIEIFAQLLGLGAFVVVGKAGILPEIAHLLPVISQRGRYIRFFVIGQSQPLGKKINTHHAARSLDAASRAVGGRGGGILRLGNRANGKQAAGNQGRKGQCFIQFHIVYYINVRSANHRACLPVNA